LVLVNYAIAACIRDRRTHQLGNIIISGRGSGMIPFDLSLSRLVEQKRIAPETALRAARDPATLQKTLER
jgi:Tfp pilus assembly pilus retraction ATPase PilT